jgi:hypothetical protein
MKEKHITVRRRGRIVYSGTVADVPWRSGVACKRHVKPGQTVVQSADCPDCQDRER